MITAHKRRVCIFIIIALALLAVPMSLMADDVAPGASSKKGVTPPKSSPSESKYLFPLDPSKKRGGLNPQPVQNGSEDVAPRDPGKKGITLRPVPGDRDDHYARGRKGKVRIFSPRPVRHGHVVPKLPRGYRRVWHSNTPYYYRYGIFYRPSPSGFIVVRAPIGLIISSLPVGYTRVWVGGVSYYVYAGAFYRKVPSGYVVVERPPGVYLEEDAPVLVEPPEAAEGIVTVTASALNVRAGPSLTHPVLYQVHRGYLLEVHGRATGWLYVELPDGEFGWVKRVFTAPLDPNAKG